MGQNTLFEEHRSSLHVLCGRALIVALVPGIIGMASQHWLAAPRGWDGGGEVVEVGYQGYGGSSSPSSPSSSSSSSGHVKNLGLWTACNNVSRCASLPSSDFPDAYGPVRGMGVTSLCLHVLCVMVGLMCSCEDPDNLVWVNAYVARLEESLAVLAGILMGCGLVIFAQATHQHPVYGSFHLDWSYWLMLFYVCCLLLAGGVIVIVRCQCACRKRMCACCLHHHLCPTICCARKRNTRRHIRATRFDHPVANNGFGQLLKEGHFNFVVENVNGSDCKDELTKTSTGDRGSFLERVKMYPSVYSSLEGIPRMVQTLSEKQVPETGEV